MAAQSLVPKNGAVSIGVPSTALVADFTAFTLAGNSPSENVTPYGTNACSKNVGCATPDFDLTVAAYALFKAANTPPLLCTGTGMFNGSGCTTTLTLDTGLTYAGQFVVNSAELQHGRMRASIPLSLRAKNGGDLTETWAIS